MTVVLWIFAALGASAVAIVLAFGFNTWRERRRHRQVYEEALRRFEARPRGKVVKIGTIVRDCLGREHPWGFEIDCEGKLPAMSQGIHGELLLGGYAKEELLEMAKRRSEFEP